MKHGYCVSIWSSRDHNTLRRTRLTYFRKQCSPPSRGRGYAELRQSTSWTPCSPLCFGYLANAQGPCTIVLLKPFVGTEVITQFPPADRLRRVRKLHSTVAGYPFIHDSSILLTNFFFSTTLHTTFTLFLSFKMVCLSNLVVCIPC